MTGTRTRRVEWRRGATWLLSLLVLVVAAAGGAGADAGLNAGLGDESCAEPSASVEPAGPEFEAAESARDVAERGELGDAIARLGAAEQALATTRNDATRARLRLHLGRTHALLAGADPGGASAHRVRAATHFRVAYDDARAAGSTRLESYALGYLGEMYEREGRGEEALSLSRRAALTAQRVGAPDALYRWLWQIGRLERAGGDDDAALASYRQAIETLEVIRQVVATQGVRKAAAFRLGVEPVYEGLVDLLLVRAHRTPEGSARQALLAEARRALEAFKAAELRDYYRDGCLDAQRVATPDELPGAVVVYPVVLPDRMELIVSVEGHLTSVQVAVDKEALVEQVRALRRFLVKRTTYQYRGPAERLYDWLVRPLAPLLAQAPESATLVFVPGGALRTIPMSVLRDSGSGHYLVERYPIAITPGLTLTAPNAIDREDVTLLAAGVTQSVQGFPALGYVAEELEAVSKLFPGRRLVDQDFLKARFEQELSERPYGIVHIASHAKFGTDAGESFVLTWNERLPMDELARIVATTRFRADRPLQLLTLSACESAAGDDLAALGLAGVALRAGARSALATLWAVDDEAAMELVTRFYGHLADPTTTRAEALRRAQREMISQHAYRHPIYWSAFVLISSWL